MQNVEKHAQVHKTGVYFFRVGGGYAPAPAEFAQGPILRVRFLRTRQVDLRQGRVGLQNLSEATREVRSEAVIRQILWTHRSRWQCSLQDTGARVTSPWCSLKQYFHPRRTRYVSVFDRLLDAATAGY